MAAKKKREQLENSQSEREFAVMSYVAGDLWRGHLHDFNITIEVDGKTISQPIECKAPLPRIGKTFGSDKICYDLHFQDKLSAFLNPEYLLRKRSCFVIIGLMKVRLSPTDPWEVEQILIGTPTMMKPFWDKVVAKMHRYDELIHDQRLINIASTYKTKECQKLIKTLYTTPTKLVRDSEVDSVAGFIANGYVDYLNTEGDPMGAVRRVIADYHRNPNAIPIMAMRMPSKWVSKTTEERKLLVL